MSSSSKQWAWQFWLAISIAFISSTVFLLVYFGTANQNAAVTYSIFSFAWGLTLIVLAYALPNRSGVPFGFMDNIPAWKVMFGVLVVPLIYFMAQTVEGVTSNKIMLISFLPEFLSRLLPGLALVTSPVPAWLQVVGWHFGDVASGETLFQVGAIEVLLLALYRFRKLEFLRPFMNPSKTQMFFVFGVFSLVNLLWTSMHGILSYNSLTEFGTAFLAGELLLSMIFVFQNLLPTIIAHGLWNIFGVFGWLTTVNMELFGIFGIILTLILFMLAKRKRRKQ